MVTIEYYVDGKLQRLACQPGEQWIAARRPGGARGAPKRIRGGGGGGGGGAGAANAANLARRAFGAMRAQGERVASRFVGAADEAHVLMAMPKSAAGAVAPGAVVVPTATMVVDGATKAERKKLLGSGLEVVFEGEEGKLLLRGPSEGVAGVQEVARLAKAAVERGNVRLAHPNFVRMLRQVKPSAAGGSPLWHLRNDGTPGVAGADVAADAAWTISRGDADVRVAVLDEGVDTKHAALRAAVVAERDFVDSNPTARPDGDDAHGTACAGIVLSRDAKFMGVAPLCSLVAARIAKGDGADGWIFDDFDTADAIDWCWKVAKADVLSNSWGGGPAAPAITAAFQRARTKGRGGKGCVVVVATGNENTAVGYPATLPFVLGVGASTPFDVRQSPKAKGGENWWGSNFGPRVDLVAPGVRIATTDISGAKGYAGNDFTPTFNGTSSATPMVAAGAALVLAVRRDLSEARVREILTQSADRLAAGGGRDNQVGWGRLNLFAALRLARR